MLVSIRRADFNSLDNVSLARACVEPVIGQIRGKDLTIKAQVYSQLTTGQRALLMFWILYGHTRNGIAQFYNEVAYLLAKVDLWLELKAGLDHLGDEEMLRVVEEMEGIHRVILGKYPLVGKVWHGIDTEVLQYEPELLTILSRLDNRFLQILPSTFEKIGEHIRNNPGDFAFIEG